MSTAGTSRTTGAIDLRSDTVTRPTPRMRRAMAEAEVGDDFFGEDPTVNRLQEAAAERFGKQAALLCPSGVMCNQLWLRVLARPGDEVLVESAAHLVNFEGGAGAALGGVQFRTIDAPRGVMTPDLLRSWVRPNRPPFGGTAMIAVEQTNNLRGGTCYTAGELRQLRTLARAHDLRMYCDGARIFNAAVALGCSVAELVEPVDGLSFCLSKGLSAPVGSVMVGTTDAIAEARVWRARYGGAMRQAGVLAAAGLVALEDMTERLADDHANARLLARAAADVDAALIDPAAVETNIVALTGIDAPRAVDGLRGHGVLAVALNATTLRMVTHADVDRRACERAGAALQQVLADLGTPSADQAATA